jgi:DegV family protein with EDD domain
MLRIVMDGAGDLPLEWIKEYGIQIIPINLHFGEQTFLQGIELSNADFYRRADQSRVIPKTSQPTPQQFVNFYRRVASAGDTILSIHVTRKLSGTMDSAEMAAHELRDEISITTFDSTSGSAAMGFMCREARLMERAGASLGEIIQRLVYIRDNISIYLTLDRLDYARKSGRVKALQAVLASLLNIKPVISLRDGVLELSDRVRTRRKALDFMLEQTANRLDGRPAIVAVVTAEDPSAGEYLMRKIGVMLNVKQLFLTDLSIGVAANLGPGTVGIVSYPVDGG